MLFEIEPEAGIGPYHLLLSSSVVCVRSKNTSTTGLPVELGFRRQSDCGGAADVGVAARCAGENDHLTVLACGGDGRAHAFQPVRVAPAEGVVDNDRTITEQLARPGTMILHIS